MFCKVPLSFRMILGIDKTDLSVFIFCCQRVGREAETERKRKRGRESRRGKYKANNNNSKNTITHALKTHSMRAQG